MSIVKREFNVDLFRIIATFFVVVLHVLGQGGIIENSSPSETTYWVASFLEICAICAVNCFALISGYVMINKSIKIKRIIGMWFQVLFYSLLFSLLFFIFEPETITFENIIMAVLPVLGKQWWYVSSYFALFFFIPFLNAAVNHISQQTYKKFLITALIGIGFIDSLTPMDAFALSGGYSALWLMIVYMFGAYIRKYDVHRKITASKSMIGFLSMVILTFLSKFAIVFLTKSIFGDVNFEKTFVSYTSITILLSAICLFLFCLNIKTNKITQKFISLLSPVTLGVYLIHVHPFVFQYVLKDFFVSFINKPIILFILYVFAAALSIFLLCTTIEWLRILIFKLIKVNLWSEFIGEKIDKLYIKIFNCKKKNIIR